MSESRNSPHIRFQSGLVVGSFRLLDTAQLRSLQGTQGQHGFAEEGLRVTVLHEIQGIFLWRFQAREFVVLEEDMIIGEVEQCCV